MITNKFTKNEVPLKTSVSRKNRLKISDGKKQYTSSVDQTTPCNTKPKNARIEVGPCNQEEKNRRKFEKAFQIRTVGICKTRAKKSIPDMFNFYVVLADYDMIPGTDKATTCRRINKAP